MAVEFWSACSKPSFYSTFYWKLSQFFSIFILYLKKKFWFPKSSRNMSGSNIDKCKNKHGTRLMNTELSPGTVVLLTLKFGSLVKTSRYWIWPIPEMLNREISGRGMVHTNWNGCVKMGVPCTLNHIICHKYIQYMIGKNIWALHSSINANFIYLCHLIISIYRTYFALESFLPSSCFYLRSSVAVSILPSFDWQHCLLQCPFSFIFRALCPLFLIF